MNRKRELTAQEIARAKHRRERAMDWIDNQKRKLPPPETEDTITGEENVSR